MKAILPLCMLSLSAMTASAQDTLPPAGSPAVSLPEAAAVRVDIQGNTLLTPAQIAAYQAPLPAPVTIETIQERVSQLQGAYRSAGYGAVVVNLPEQTITSGVVRLQVVEGKLADVYYQGNLLFTNDNVRRSLPTLIKGQTPDLNAVDANALQVNESPAKASRITFQPGQFPGQVDALVVTTERKPTQYSIGFDNTGNEATGDYRASLGFQHANLFQRDHILGVRVEASPTQDAHSNAASLSYAVPFYGHLSALELSVSYSDVESKAVATAAGDALFAGQGSSVGLRYRWYLPKFGQLKHRLQVGIDQRQYENDCSIGVFGSAACGSSARDVSVRPLVLGYDARVTDRFIANLQVSNNAFPGGSNGAQSDFEAARPGAKDRFTVVRGSLGASYRFNPGITLNWRNSFQYTPDALVSGEASGAGGLATVRGYEERELVGDKNIISSLELGAPPLRFTNKESGVVRQQVQAVAFGDWARAVNNRGTFCDADGTSCDIAGAGVGLRWSYSTLLFARADLGRALKDSSQTDKGDYKLHFSIGLGL